MKRESTVFPLVHLMLAVCLLGGCQEKPAEKSNDEVVWEETKFVAAWSANLVQRHRGPANSDAIVSDLILSDRTGKARELAIGIVGPIVLFEAQERIFSCEARGAIMTGKAPMVFNLEGNSLEGPEHPGYLRTCFRIQDSSLLLLHYDLMREGKPYSVVRVLDLGAKVVLEKELDGPAELEVSDEGKLYRINIPEPEFPG